MSRKSSASAEAPASKTPRVVTKSHPCAMTGHAYWALRDDDGFDQFTAKADGNTHEVVSRVTDEDGFVTRVSKVTALKNPIPKALRKTLGCVDGFAFQITERWWPGACGASTPMIFSTQPAVLPDRISVTGKQWVETTGHSSCRLYFELSVSCRITGVGGAVARGIESGTLAAYASLPERALHYSGLGQQPSDSPARAQAIDAFDADDGEPETEDTQQPPGAAAGARGVGVVDAAETGRATNGEAALCSPPVAPMNPTTPITLVFALALAAALTDTDDGRKGAVDNGGIGDSIGGGGRLSSLEGLGAAASAAAADPQLAEQLEALVTRLRQVADTVARAAEGQRAGRAAEVKKAEAVRRPAEPPAAAIATAAAIGKVGGGEKRVAKQAADATPPGPADAADNNGARDDGGDDDSRSGPRCLSTRLREGWLEKRPVSSRPGLSTWQQRWLVLTPSAIEWYASEAAAAKSGAEPKGRLPLLASTEASLDDDDAPTTLRIRTPSATAPGSRRISMSGSSGGALLSLRVGPMNPSARRLSSAGSAGAATTEQQASVLRAWRADVLQAVARLGTGGGGDGGRGVAAAAGIGDAGDEAAGEEAEEASFRSTEDDETQLRVATAAARRLEGVRASFSGFDPSAEAEEEVEVGVIDLVKVNVAGEPAAGSGTEEQQRLLQVEGTSAALLLLDDGAEERQFGLASLAEVEQNGRTLVLCILQRNGSGEQPRGGAASGSPLRRLSWAKKSGAAVAGAGAGAAQCMRLEFVSEERATKVRGMLEAGRERALASCTPAIAAVPTEPGNAE